MSLGNSNIPHQLPVTALRRRFERTRSFEPKVQIEELVEQLTHPGPLLAEVLDAYDAMQSCFEAGCDELAKLAKKEEPPAGTSAKRGTTLVENFIWETRELMVLGDRCSFTCLATNVNPLSPTADVSDGLSTGLDYVGLTCDTSATLVVGAVQAPGDTTAYPLLLRLLACLTEIAPPTLREHLNQRHFKGVIGPTSKFDLNLVRWDRSETLETNPIGELTRDLAEHIKRGLLESGRFPPILRDIVCLRMNPDRFDGRMRFDWRV